MQPSPFPSLPVVRRDTAGNRLPTAELVSLLERSSEAGAWSMELPDHQSTWTDHLLCLLELAPDTVPAAAAAVDFYAPEARERMQALIERLRTSALPFDEVVQIVTASGRRLWVRSVGEAVREPGGSIVRIQGVLRDVTDSKRVQQELQVLGMRLSTTLASITDAFATLDRDGRFTFVNPESQRLLRRAGTELLGQPVWDTVCAANADRMREHLHGALAKGRPVEFEEFDAQLGKWLELRAYPFEEGLAVYLRDTTDRRVATDVIERMAFFDPLTQLPNRRLLMDRLQVELSLPATESSHGALMFIDLDHFKAINDTMGHAKGDLLLRLAAQRVAGCVRSGDTVARLGGDEFVVMLLGLGAEERQARAKACAVADKILQALREPFELAGYLHHGSCSIGMSLFGRGEQDLGVMLKQTDLAMYRAKAAGRDTKCFFEAEMQASVDADTRLVSALRVGLNKREFLLHYQPQVGADGRMFGVEALIRWARTGQETVLPAAFIGQAEDSGLILPLGRWVIATACEQLARWSTDPGTRGLSISVNVSARQFRHPEFVSTVLAALDGKGCERGRLRLELPESLMGPDAKEALAKMAVLRAAGIGLSVDDFGIGSAGLAQLRTMPLEEVKIDRRFVGAILTDRTDAAIARTIVDLAASLDLKVIAEGVETEAQRDFLASIGCTAYQGFFYSPPVPVDELHRFIGGMQTHA